MKILVIQQKMIGDVLTSSILFEALRRKFPAAELHYLIYRHTVPVVENNPNIDKLILFEDEDKKPARFLSLLKQIRNQNYEVVIDVYSKIGTALISAFSDASSTISYHKWYTSSLYSKTFRQKSRAETAAGLAIENRLLLLQGISADFPKEIKPKIWLTADEKNIARQTLQKAGIKEHKPLVMCSILGSSPDKTYPFPYMAQVLDFVVEKTGAQLLFNYFPKQLKEAEEILLLCKAETKKKVYFDIFGSGLREFIALTAQCDALIGNEGGAVNMAKAVDVPTFSIFSPQISKQAWFSNYDDKHMAVHLEDYQPESFRKRVTEKGEITRLYHNLHPELFVEDLMLFLKSLKIVGTFPFKPDI